ncbi:hypothetical protein [Flaviaesturariibacter aridisoli]|uniref:Uncharacterized protein n=1 Tax=Flaviaesturariibacter aridisoli TaxID=2545761 RepID=A0A4V2WME5_9BACT|nr:hypothetical protein [Flaviaesturariibacter aridisoli]TCZ68348.1 hypothetical protein E0486_14245 [Flaviaesturariibacter aridisoli]
MKAFLHEILRDKNGQFSIRECLIAVVILMIVASWIAQQFFGKPVPEFMFYSFTSLVAAGCFGYSIERKSSQTENNNNQ